MLNKIKTQQIQITLFPIVQQYVLENVFTTYVENELLLEGIGVKNRANQCLEVVHHEYSTHHSTITEASTTVKPKEGALFPYNLYRLNKRTIGLPFDISLHTSLDCIEGMSEVTGEEST